MQMAEHQKYCEDAADARLDQLTQQLAAQTHQLEGAHANERKLKQTLADTELELVQSKEAW